MDDKNRPTIRVRGATGGWPYPWPNVAELARQLPSDQWTLIGGLMTQMHAIHRGVDAVRPTNDVDIVLHIETTRGAPDAAADALEVLGYRIKEGIDPRNEVAHRFTRGDTHIDIVTSAAEDGGADRREEQGARKTPSTSSSPTTPRRASRRRCVARTW